MLNWLTSRLGSSDNSSHPLGSEKGISTFLAEIPTADPQRTLRELHDWLGDPESFISQMPLPRAVRVVEALDEFAQDAVARSWEKLLAEAKANKQAQLPAGVLKNHFAGSYNSNRKIFELLAAADPGHDKKVLARYAARAMYSWGQYKKLARMTYQAAETSWWSSTHSLLHLARELGVSHQSTLVYSQSQLTSSVWKEYQIAILFETAPLTNLAANEIDATDRLVRWIEPHCRFVDTRSELTPFCIEPEGEHTPARCLEDGNYSAETRYFGVGEGQNQLDQFRANIVRDGNLPEWLTRSGCTRAQLVQLLQILIANWSATPPSRKHPRMDAKGNVRVVNGLDMAFRMLAASEFAKSGRDLDYDNYLKNYHARHRDTAIVTDEAPPPPPKTPMDVLRLLESAGDQQMMEHWEVIDISRGGLGVRFSVRRPWTRIGALVAYRDERDLSWRIGIVRRLGSSHGKPNAGLSTFPGIPLCSQIRVAAEAIEPNAWAQSTKETSGLGWHNAILLSEESRQILIPTGVFTPERAVHISVQGRWRQARLFKLEARGEGYDLAVYRDDDPAP